jgi:hypothetical protein
MPATCRDLGPIYSIEESAGCAGFIALSRPARRKPAFAAVFSARSARFDRLERKLLHDLQAFHHTQADPREKDV